MQTHQFAKTAQLRLLKIVEFPVKMKCLAASFQLSLVARVLVQGKGVVMQLKAKKENLQG
jgi:hypothetical protein